LDSYIDIKNNELKLSTYFQYMNAKTYLSINQVKLSHVIK